MLKIIGTSFFVLYAAVAMPTHASLNGSVPLAHEIVYLIENHQIMSDQEIITVASHIVEISVPTSIKPFDPLTKEQAEAAAEIFSQKSTMLADCSCPGCNRTPVIDTNPLSFAIDILMDYAHPENYYR